MEIDSMNEINVKKPKNLQFGRIFRMWWPLAASWLLMSIEGPAMNAVVARLQNPEINLAAYGGIIQPASLIINAPIVMLLVASTAMSQDHASYKRLLRFTHLLSGALTVIHFLIAFTPLYYFVAEKLIGAPVEIIEPGRIGLMIMLPWTWSIGFRRFQQGVMIRCGHSREVMNCTIARLLTLSLVLFIGYYFIPEVSGVVLAASAQALGVISEAVVAGIRVRPVIRKHVINAPAVKPFTWKEFSNFYIPLILTTILSFVAQPIGSATISRMPKPVESLAVWSIMSNLIFLTRSSAIAYNEVVVALLGEKGSGKSLMKFAQILALGLTIIILLFTFTPIADIWFENVNALSQELASLARNALWFILLIPAASAFQSLFQGTITFSRHTRAITESVVIFLLSMFILSILGVIWGNVIGLYVGAAAFASSEFLRTFWLWFRSKKTMLDVQLRDDGNMVKEQV